jgi:hypothetical protein
MRKALVLERGHVMTVEEVRESAMGAQARGEKKVRAQAAESIAVGEGNPDWLMLLRVKKAEEKKTGE